MQALADATPLVLKLQGGRAPFRWLANGKPLPDVARGRTATWQPDGAGYSTLTVIDAADHRLLREIQFDPARQKPDDLARTHRTLLVQATFIRELYDAPYPFTDSPRPQVDEPADVGRGDEASAGRVVGTCFTLHRTGFGEPPCHHDAGGLLPHPFTLTAGVSGESCAGGGLLSVPLSVGFRRLGFPQRPALRCPDFPRESPPATAWPARSL